MTIEEAKAYLKNYQCVCAYGVSPFACKDKEGCEFSKAVRTICEAKRPQGEWIPVSERLPDIDGEEYLVYRKTDTFVKRPFCIDIARWYSDDTENNGFNKYSEVLAWMPLPESYKKDGADMRGGKQ